jgi:uncharacterized protein (DUF362 family)/NAD-dependent dihydropyrimidine dehydrogenase PreA subunit
MNLIFSKKITSYDIQKISDFLNGSFIKSNVYKDSAQRDIVLLKPNLLSKPTKENDFVTTNRIVIESVVKLLIANGINSGKIVIGDGASAIHKNMDSIFEDSGIGDITRRYNVKTVNFNKLGYDVRNGIKLTEYLNNNPYIINLAKLKTHMLTKLTLSVKNLYGLLPPEVKLAYHSQYSTEDMFCHLLSKIYNAVAPDFNVIDGIIGMEGNGPGGGERAETNIMACSKNGYALDHFISGLCGYKRDEMLFIKHAVKNNYYDGNFSVEGDYEKIIMKRPTRNSFTLSLKFAGKRFTRFLFSSYPKVMNETCMKCMKCMKMCPEKAIVLKNGFPYVREKKCVSCYCCIEVCPYKSIKTKKSAVEGVWSVK